SDLTLTEGNSGTISISLSKSWEQDIVIPYSSTQNTATQGSDYSVLTGFVTIPAGSTSATIAVSTMEDTWYEGDETFTMSYAKPANATIQSTSVNKTVTIQDNEAMPSVQFTVTNDTVAESAGVKSIQVELSGVCERPV